MRQTPTCGEGERSSIMRRAEIYLSGALARETAVSRPVPPLRQGVRDGGLLSPLPAGRARAASRAALLILIFLAGCAHSCPDGLFPDYSMIGMATKHCLTQAELEAAAPMAMPPVRTK